MRNVILALCLAACTPISPTAISQTDARGIAMLHDLRAMDPCEADPTCRELRRGRN